MHKEAIPTFVGWVWPPIFVYFRFLLPLPWGLKMVVEMKRQLNANTSGFDLLKTADGEKWSFVLDDGFHDKYNFGGRTMVIFDDQLYVGTANPFYGAQLWRIDDGKESETTCLCLRPV